MQQRTAPTHACMFSPSGHHQDQSLHRGVAPEKWACRQNGSLWSSWLWVNVLFLRCLLPTSYWALAVKSRTFLISHLTSDSFSLDTWIL